MMQIPQEKDVVDKLVAWGTAHALIRAMILTSSRTRPDGPVDPLSDYDLILAVSDVGLFAFDDAWISAYGRPMVRWGDQREMHDLATYFRGVVYQNAVKIDYSIWPVELLERIASSASLPDQLDVGYRVLLDKDRRTAGWKPPSYQAHIPARPAEAEYQALVEEFWWARPTSPRACGAMIWSLPNGSWTKISSSKRCGACSNGASRSIITGL